MVLTDRRYLRRFILDELKVDLKDGVYKQNHVVTKSTAETI